MTTDMTRGRPLRLLVRFALPLTIGNVFQQLYNMVDAVIVGKCISADALAAVGTAGTVTWLMNSILVGLSMGSGVVVAQNFGQKNREELQSAVTAFAWLMFAVNLCLSLPVLFFAPQILRILKVPEDILADAVIYLRICAFFHIAVAAYNGAAAVLRSMGDSRTPLAAMIAASFVNVFFNLLFVLHFHMGVAGVAYGTILAQIASGGICLLQIVRHKKELGLKQMYLLPKREMLKKASKAGLPTALQFSFISLGGVCIQGLVNTFGVGAMAAYAAAQKVESVAIQVIASGGNALSVFTGQNIGSGDYERIRIGLKDTLTIMLTEGLVLGVSCLFFAEPLLLLFLDSKDGAEAIAIGVQIMRIMSIAYLIAGIMNSYLNVLRGAGDVSASFLAGVAEIVGRIFFAGLLAVPLGATGIWIATPLSWGCGCVYSVCRYYSGKWKEKSFV